MLELIGFVIIIWAIHNAWGIGPKELIDILFSLIRSVYFVFDPRAKRDYLECEEKYEEEYRKLVEQEEAEKRRKDEEIRRHRDADQQITPYTYQIGKHGNESLAIRYGIANNKRKRKPNRDQVYSEPENTIRLQKTKKISKDLYEVLLTDFRDRKAKAIIETGTEYVKTFYPLDNNWFDKFNDLEEALKGNNSFTLKELAAFHIQKAVGFDRQNQI